MVTGTIISKFVRMQHGSAFDNFEIMVPVTKIPSPKLLLIRQHVMINN